MKVWGPFKEQLGNWLAQKYWICLHQSQERIAPSLFPCCNISNFFSDFFSDTFKFEIVFKSSCCGDFKKQNENDFLFLDFSKVGLGEGGRTYTKEYVWIEILHFWYFSEWLTMARTPSSRSSLREKLQEEFLSCKICLESFIKPKALPCLHSFCEHCLRDYVRRHPGEKPGHFPCPMCRKDTKIPERGIGDFQDNFLLLSLSDTLDEDEEPWNHGPSPGKQTTTTLVSPPKSFAPPTPQEQHLRTFEWVQTFVS